MLGPVILCAAMQVPVDPMAEARKQIYKIIRQYVELTTKVKTEIAKAEQEIIRQRQALAYPVDALRDGGDCLRRFYKTVTLAATSGKVRQSVANLRRQWGAASPRTALLYSLYGSGGSRRHLARAEVSEVWGPSDHLPDADWRAVIDWSQQNTSLLLASHSRSNGDVGAFGGAFEFIKNVEPSPGAATVMGADLAARAGEQVLQQVTLRNQTLQLETLYDMDETRETAMDDELALDTLAAAASFGSPRPGKAGEWELR
jgi:hypothetical protein